MKLTLYLLKRIFIYFAILFIPVAIFVITYQVNNLGFTVTKLGIRSIFEIGIKNLPLIIIASYILALILSIALIDKIKVDSLLVLHIPPIIISIGLITIFYFSSGNNNFFITEERVIRPGYRLFFKERVFNEINNDILYIYSVNNKNRYLLYNREKNNIILLSGLSFKDDRVILLDIKKQPVMSLQYKEISIKKDENLLTTKYFKRYIKTIKFIVFKIKEIYGSLKKIDGYIFLGSMLVSFLILSIPLAFIINDGGWGVTGLIGVILIMGFVPYIYNILFKFNKLYKPIVSLMGSYSYLIYPAIISLIGIILDIIISFSKKAEV